MAWPVTPILPTNVNPGDRITAGYTNVQAQAFRDLWTNLQVAQTPWQQNVSAAGHELTSLGVLRFVDGSVQATAFWGIPATQTPWLQDINAAQKLLLSAGAVTIWPTSAANPRFGVLNLAGTQWDWAVGPSGDFYSATGRSIATGGSLTLGNGSFLNWTPNPDASGAMDTQIIRAYAGALSIRNANGVASDFYAGRIFNREYHNADASKLYINASGQMFAYGVRMPASSYFEWAAGPDPQAVADVAIGRFQPGALQIVAAGGGRGVLWVNSVVAENRVMATVFSIYNATDGVTGSFTSADGKTITVRGGIILGIV